MQSIVQVSDPAPVARESAEPALDLVFEHLGLNVGCGNSKFKGEEARLDDIEEALVTRISGRLHRVEFEPGGIGVRTASGVDWHCSYSEDLQQRVLRLVGHIVTVRGQGRRTSPLRGTMALQSIDPVEQGARSTLFTAEQIDDIELLADQGILRPQGLDALEPAREWDELDHAYVAALLDQ